ncbi:hypothetical protein B0H14DRAFT_3448862 [Mycena olivaceomarginata]|nr:hypothetical protein B0H14DRAFT_3448862 [Mycena olivaceomarginata]
MAWSLASAEEGLGKLYTQPEDIVVEEHTSIYVVDLFSAYYADVPLVQGEHDVASAYVGQGLMPAAPYSPNVTITIRTLEIFWVMQLRCPRLGVQAFVRALCDIHGVAPRPYLGAQFSVAFDVYLAIVAEVEKRTQAALGWKARRHSKIPVLCTFDGNNSLSRFWRREREWVDDSGVAVPGASKERADDRVPPGDRYLPPKEVNKWADEGLEELMKGFLPGTGAEDPDDDGCDERWANMKEDVTARAYGMYDETGFFPCLCRHSFVFVVVDMVKSGELAKYGFSITAHLLNVLGEVATGYDIGWQVWEDGVGLEDLKECESYFSKSNGLASRTRYSTPFHRQQAITTYLKHADTVDAYQGLSTVLAKKYRRALKIKATLPMLRETMASLGVETRSVFETWLEKEKTYLNSLTKEPAQETLQVEYYQKLVNLHDYESRLNEIRGNGLPFVEVVPSASYSAVAGQTQRIETQWRHATEVVSKTLATVQDLELRLGITERWERALMVTNRRYQRALDELEGLVVARMFELSKVHMADTGYKLRKHIAKTLQAQSKGVRSALDRYNDAAVMLSPPRTPLSWEQIVDYTFLADFDLLREGREDIRAEPWAQPAGRLAMDQHYKLLRAEEEIARLNVEIPCLITYMVDEERFLVYHKGRLQAEGKPALAHQVKVQRVDRARFNSVHMERLTKLSKEEGFTASLSPGVCISKERMTPGAASSDGEDVEMQAAYQRPVTVPPLQDEEDESNDEDADINVEAIADAFEAIVRITHDGPAPAPAF